MQQEGKWLEAKALYCEILDSELMEESGEEWTASSTILRLKFLIFKNLASIAREQGDLSAAADAYIEVLNAPLSYTWVGEVWGIHPVSSGPCLLSH